MTAEKMNEINAQIYKTVSVRCRTDKTEQSVPVLMMSVGMVRVIVRHRLVRVRMREARALTRRQAIDANADRCAPHGLAEVA